MSNKLTSVLGVSLIALIAALASASGTAPAAQEKNADSSVPLVIPKSERTRPNPVPRVPEAIASGRSLFSSQCAMCHGIKGDGRGDLSKSIKIKMPDLSDPRLHRKRTDGDFFYIITRGHGQMPGETRLPEQNRWEMIHFIRTLEREKAAGK